MAVYRVQIDVAFDDMDDADRLIREVEKVKLKIKDKSGFGTLTIEKKCEYHKCYHDEATPQPCEAPIQANLD